METTPIVIGDGTEESWELVAFLSRIIPIEVSATATDWERVVIERSPELGPYLVYGMKEQLFSSIPLVKIDAVEPEFQSSEGMFKAPIDIFLSALAAGIGI